MRPESKLQFDRAADALGLDNETRDLAWRRMADIGLTPDDPTVIFLAVGGLLERAAVTIPGAIDALPDRIEEAAKRAVGPVTKAATARVEASQAALMERSGELLAATTERYFDRRERTRDFRIGLHLIGLITAIALACGLAGWGLGRTNVSHIATEWAALASRADSGTWFSLAQANPDIAGTVRKFCAPGSATAFSVQGARACTVSLWLDGAPAPTRGTAQGLYTGILDWLAGWGPVWLVSGGLLAGLLGRKAILSVTRARPVAWLLG